MTKKKFWSFFAIIFAIIFALALAAGLAACGESEKGDFGEKLSGEHIHEYTAENWEWADTGHTFATAMATCANSDGLCDEPITTLIASDIETVDTATCLEGGTITHIAYYEGKEVKRCEGEPSEKASHNIVAVDKKDATCTEPGYEAHWKCSVCGTLFSDEEGETEIYAAEEIPEKGHSYSSESYVAWKWEKDNSTDTGYKATATVTCDDCKAETEVTGSVTGPDDDGAYTATAFLGGESFTSGPYIPGETGNIYTVEITGAFRIEVGGTTKLTAEVTLGEKEVSGGTLIWYSDEGAIEVDEKEGEITGKEPTAGDGAVVWAIYYDEEGYYGIGKAYVIVIAATENAEGERYEVDVLFSDYKDNIGQEEMVALDEKGVIKYIDYNKFGSVTDDGALKTGKYTNHNGTNYSNYILIDFSDFLGYSFEINITFGAEASGAILAIVNTLDEGAGGEIWDENANEGEGGMVQSDNTGRFGSSKPDLSDLVEAKKGIKYTSGTATLTYEGVIYDPNKTEEGEKDITNGLIYIVWDSDINIESIEINLWTGSKYGDLDLSWQGLDIDFSNPPAEFVEYYERLNSGDFTMESETTISVSACEDVITLIDDNAETNWASGKKCLDTNGITTYATYEHELTNYFILDLRGLEGEIVTVTIVYSTTGETGNLYLVSEAENLSSQTPRVLYILATGEAGTDRKLSKAVGVPQSGYLYIEYSCPVSIKSIKVVIGNSVDTAPVYDIEIDTETTYITLNIDEDTSVEGYEFDYAELGYKVTMDGDLLSELPSGAEIIWKSSDVAVATIDGSGKITAVGEGYALITVTFIYETDDYKIEIESGRVTVSVILIRDDGGIHINFSDSKWGGIIQNGEFDITDAEEGETATIKYKAANNVASYTADDNGIYAFKTGKESDNGGTYRNTYNGPNLYNYFTITVPEGATYMDITVVFSSVTTAGTGSGGSDLLTGFLALVTEIPASLWSKGGSSYSSKVDKIKPYLVSGSEIVVSTVASEQVTFSWSGDVTGGEELYIVLGSSQYIYSMDVYFTISEGYEEEDNVDVMPVSASSNACLIAGDIGMDPVSVCCEDVLVTPLCETKRTGGTKRR